jgi:hypothetical protein
MQPVSRQRLSKHISAKAVTSRNKRGAVFSVPGPYRSFIGDNEGRLDFSSSEYKDDNGACLSEL